MTNINSALKFGNQYARGGMVELWNQYKLYPYNRRNTANGIRHFNTYITYLKTFQNIVTVSGSVSDGSYAHAVFSRVDCPHRVMNTSDP